MNLRIALLAASALAIAAAPAFAKTSPIEREAMVPQSIIASGPHLEPGATDDSSGWAQAELDYLHQVCPTVLAHPGQHAANLVAFCHETPAS